MPEATAPIELVQSNRMQNRNFRMSWDIDQGLLRVATERASRDEVPNVSLVFRMICDGRLGNLIDLGVLCPLCSRIDCTEHTKKERLEWFTERDRREFERLSRKFTKSSKNGANRGAT